MAGWLSFPGGEKRAIAEEALDFITKEERNLRASYEKAKADKLRLEQSPPSYFNSFQFQLAAKQFDDEIHALSVLLLNAGRKLDWEIQKKWK